MKGEKQQDCLTRGTVECRNTRNPSRQPQVSNSTGTHLLTAIIDASWKVNAYYNGVCMRRGDCYLNDMAKITIICMHLR